MTAPILVIAGSVRARRTAPAIAAWVANLGRATTAHNFEVIDLAEWLLPMDDEPAIPRTGAYEQEHSRAWSLKIAAASAVVFVTPQYNGGYPAALKNAIDHLYAEWNDKPALIITYGGHGGARCGAQLDQVCQFVKMKPIPTRPALTLPHDMVEANAGEIDPVATFAVNRAEVCGALAELKYALTVQQT